MPVGSVSVPAPVFTMSVYLSATLPSPTIDVMIVSAARFNVIVPPTR